MKKMRLSTMMLLVIIAGLTVALVAERRRSAAILAEAQAQRELARKGEQVALYQAQVARAQALLQAREAEDAARSVAKPSGSTPR
ncbi:MAG: hypothetical protein JWN86_2621 [Planctomycetota bacterium]|nr:hypothetical protein [Planctomycetota bacterium]